MVGFGFNGPFNTIKVISSQSVYLATLFLDSRKYFMINPYERITADLTEIEPLTFCSLVGQASYSHRGWPYKMTQAFNGNRF